MTASLGAGYRRLLTSRNTVRQRLAMPVDASSLAVFRIAFGAVMLWETWRIHSNDWIDKYFTGKEFYFKFWPFDFVQPLPEAGMEIQLVVMGIFALFVVLGLFYRISATGFFLMITYLFLLEKARYLNHIYLVCLLSFLMIFLPAHRTWSLDALLWPRLGSATVPGWSLWLLRFQVAAPMFFGGIAKLNFDWLRGEPMRAWLSVRTDFPLLGQAFTNESVVWAMVYGGLLIDLLFVFYMLNRRTRVFGFILVLAFHLMNARLFGIGIFPWMMIVATLVFFEPDWPRRVWQDIRLNHPYRLPALIFGFALGFVIGGLLPGDFNLVEAIIGGLGVAVAAYHLDEPFLGKPTADNQIAGNAAEVPLQSGTSDLTMLQKSGLALLGIWVAFQVLVPLRHFAIPGLVHWTEEGHTFSWHMKLRDKDSEGFFVVTDTESGSQWVVDPRQHLSRRQTSKMAARPEMILQFAHYLEELAIAEGHQDVTVQGQFMSSLNGRLAQTLVDPTADLTQYSRPWLGHADWILPLEIPLRVKDQSQIDRPAS